MDFNEDTRVKIPAIIHLCRLGYEYMSLSSVHHNNETNIFEDIFSTSIQRINPDQPNIDITRLLEEISFTLDYDDLGKAFYQKLTANSGIRLIDFNHFDNNSFHVVTELTYKKDEDEFRPDITLLINGMPLAFIEVKKPNNQNGILAERERMNTRFKNPKFKKFINIFQILVFSNNMEYDPESIEPVQGAFYATTSRTDVCFNFFREEDDRIFSQYQNLLEDTLEDTILEDTNHPAIKHTPEFLTNKDPRTPTNRILTSLFSKERLAFLLKYGIAYVQGSNGLEKHIMRYPQMFATKAIQKKLDSGLKKGVIWHTQGSGKTALAYYNVHVLTDYFQKKSIVPKFYFIVDRIDLMNQASKEFTSRGLSVHTVSTKDELVQDFKKNTATHGNSGKREITVINIQKFNEDATVLDEDVYDTTIQRIYFLDEVHRGHKDCGYFHVNLINSDRNAIFIGLTGTPLLHKDSKTTSVLGGYIHTYYYNSSIADGYTLRLIREGIETKYKMQLTNTLNDISVKQGAAGKSIISAHATFAEPMLDYIVNDFINSRNRFGDQSIGGMVVCESSEQAKMLYKIFNTKYNAKKTTIIECSHEVLQVAEPVLRYGNKQVDRKPNLTASLILHDVDSLSGRKQEIEKFKEGKRDLLFVVDMLLTGFDAGRLKKLYLGRVIREHNLLQTLTRVNRPYKNFRYGYVVDFADIRNEFDKTNSDYLHELQEELGEEMASYSNLFKSAEEIETEIRDIKNTLCRFDLVNGEIFSQQISEIENKKSVLEIKKALENAKSLYNVIRLYGHDELLEALDFKKMNQLFNETARHLDLLNLKESLQNKTDASNLLNIALEDALFMFRKVSEEEMLIADQLKAVLKKTRETMQKNVDKKDPVFVSLYEELQRLFEKKNLEEITQNEMKVNIDLLQSILDRAAELDRKNGLLLVKYGNDPKYARIHKRIIEKGTFALQESRIYEAMNEVKREADEIIISNGKMLDNEAYFSQKIESIVIKQFGNVIHDLDPDDVDFINTCVAREYLNEYHGECA